MKLFVALDVPDSIKAALRILQPGPARGLRPIPPEQMHVTLHFIGDAETGVVCDALAAIESMPVPVSIRGLGRFRLNGGRTILWAGVTETPALLELHAACGRALAAIGIELERRRFTPHVTLARFKPLADRSIAAAFLSTGEDRDFGSFVADHFVLYNSVSRGDGAHYEAIQTFPLR